MNRLKQIVVIALLLFQFSVLPSCEKTGAQPVPEPEIELTGILKTLQKEHPRLLLTDARLQELKTLSNTDLKLKKYAADVVAQADKDIFKSPIQHVLIGPRLLDKSRECLNRVYNLAFAYRWTDNPKYLAAAVANMKNVCTFPDWNPSHFLDVAEMTHAVAIGYDWLYNKMDQPSRDQIKAGLIKLGLNEGKKAYASNAWWAKVDHNWNQVCNSGLTIGALAIAETDPDIALAIVPKAIEYLPFALKNYGPDGVWGEGPGYWGYATDYTAYGISAMQTALGSDFNLTKLPGMNLTGYFPIYSAGPTGYMLNYADAGEKSKLGAPHPDLWLAGVFSNNHFSDFVIDQLETRTANVFDVIWFRPYANSAAKRDLDKFFDGSVSLYFSRSSWTDPNALWIGLKAGYNKVNHAHLDLGNFEMDALGVRWARDLGSDDYNLPDYFGKLRYTYYRLQSISHNVPLLNGQNQREDATSKFIKHGEGIAEPFAVLDFTSAYKDFASAALRGMKVVDERKAILIQDEFVLTKSAEVVWGMTTDAAIQIINSKQAELTLGGQKMTAKILSPENAEFKSESAQQVAPQKPNTGVSRLLAKVPATSGNVTVSVLLTPQWPGNTSNYSTEIISLTKW
ncbi:MAG: heparinase II/III family protein [Prolixibacteraceae bacterium]|nr:heparinase II/III family protein [Prolixibacteraceae bacterium]